MAVRPMGYNSAAWVAEAEDTLQRTLELCAQLSYHNREGHQLEVAHLVFRINGEVNRTLDYLERAKAGAVVEVTEK